MMKGTLKLIILVFAIFIVTKGFGQNNLSQVLKPFRLKFMLLLIWFSNSKQNLLKIRSMFRLARFLFLLKRKR